MRGPCPSPCNSAGSDSEQSAKTAPALRNARLRKGNFQIGFRFPRPIVRRQRTPCVRQRSISRNARGLVQCGFAPYTEGMAGQPAAPAREPSAHERREWQEEFEAAARRSLRDRFKYAFIKTYKPVLDDAPFRAFSTTREYRDWCAENLPSWLGYGREV